MTLFSPTSIMTETEKSTLKISHSASEISSHQALDEVSFRLFFYHCFKLDTTLSNTLLAGSLQLGLLPVQNESNIEENPKIKSMEVKIVF